MTPKPLVEFPADPQAGDLSFANTAPNAAANAPNMDIPAPATLLQTPAPSIMDSIIENARQFNVEANLYEATLKSLKDDPEADPNFKPFDYARDNMDKPEFQRALPEIIDRIQGLKSQVAFDDMIAGVNKELDQENVATENGMIPMLVGGAIGFITSPTTWLSGGVANGLYSATRAGRMAAQGFLRGAGRGAAIAVGETIPLDLAQRAANYTHDGLDSLENFGFAAVTGGVLGRLLHTDAPGTPFSAEGKGWKAAAEGPSSVDVNGSTDWRSLSAAGVFKDKPAANGTMGIFDFATPTGRAISRAADSEVDFGIHSKLYEMPVMTEGNLAGRSTEPSAELLSRVLFDSRYFSSQQEVTDIYKQMALDVFGEGRIKNTVKNLAGIEQNRLTMDEFAALVEDYRRAKLAMEDVGAELPAAKAIIDNPHVNPQVSSFIKQAAEARDRYYAQFAKDLVDHGIIAKEFHVVSPKGKTKVFSTTEDATAYIAKQKEKLPEYDGQVIETVPDIRQSYTPIILDRAAISYNETEFRELLRDVLKANPPPEFLMSRYGKSSLRELDPTDKELAVGDWVNYQKAGLERNAEKAAKEAEDNLEQTLKDLRASRAEGTKVERKTTQAVAERARLVERDLQTQWEAKSLIREEAAKELQAIKTAWDLAQARKAQRDAQVVKPLKDVGATELQRLERSLVRQEADATKAKDTVLDALTDPLTPPGRAMDAGDVAKVQGNLAKSTQSVIDNNQAAKVDPLVAKKAPEADFDTANIGKLTERLREANARMTQLDKEIEVISQQRRKVSLQRAAAEAHLEHLSTLRKDIAKNTRILRAEAAKAGRRAERAKAALDGVYEGKFKTAEELVNEVIDKIVRGKDIPLAQLEENVGQSGRTRRRELFVGDALLDPRLKKFIETDGDRLAEGYGREMAPRIALRRSFGNDIDDSLTQPLEDLRAEWADKIAKAPEGKARDKVVAQAKASEEDFLAMRDKLLNRYGRPDDPESALMFLNRNTRRLNVSRLMGLSLLSSFTDLATGVFSTGRTFAWLPRMAKSASGFAMKMQDNELSALMLGSEQSRYQALASRRLMPEENPWENYNGFGTGATRRVTAGIDKGMDFLARSTMVLSGQGGWTAKLKYVFGTLQIDNMSRDLPRWSSLPEKTKAQFARVGIDDAWAKRIASQLEKHSEEIDGVRVPNGREWTDRDAYMRFKLALTRAMNESVVEPGMGDLPLFMSKPAGQLFMQFQSYAFAATNRYVRLAWQARDINSIVSLHMMLGFSALGYVAREFVKGTNDKGETPEQRLAKNKPADWMYESISRSALPGMWSMGIDAFRKVAQDPMQKALGVEVFGNVPSRLAAQSAFTNVFGPTFGLLENLGSFGQAVANVPNEGWQKVAQTGQRLAPFGNLLPMMALHSASEATFK